MEYNAIPCLLNPLDRTLNSSQVPFPRVSYPLERAHFPLFQVQTPELKGPLCSAESSHDRASKQASKGFFFVLREGDGAKTSSERETHFQVSQSVIGLAIGEREVER